MLFNSHIFLFFFLPLTLIVYYLIGARGHHHIAIAWLVGASLFFYGWWNPAYLPLLVLSITGNYLLGAHLAQSYTEKKVPSLRLLISGVATNLLLLGYFKYTNFLITNINTVGLTHLPLQQIVLPLGISFFTFTQIAYLVDAYRGETRETNFLYYFLFVTFFPHLIAGPIIHHREMLPQFSHDAVYRFRSSRMAIGLTIFIIGLFKKTVLADGISEFVGPVFSAAEQGNAPTLAEAWVGALAYTLQIYFDFSGYSDMAVGLARMFGIRFPMNFYSPYKSLNIIEFWRRWHITLSRFLRDYLYITLGGNRHGRVLQLTNLLVTMLLGGLWHGASWTFVIWGGLHGVYLVINHAWRWLVRAKVDKPTEKLPTVLMVAYWFLTFSAVVVAWVFFRANSINGAMLILAGMAGMHGIALPARYAPVLGSSSTWLTDLGIQFSSLPLLRPGALAAIVALLAIVLAAPNSMQIMGKYRPALLMGFQKTFLRPQHLVWQPNSVWLLAMIVVSILALRAMNNISEFLYYQF